MEWQVGQWVDYRGEKARIENIDNALTVRFANGSSVRLCLETAFVKPFVWQVGRKYKTTLECVTATIQEGVDGRFLAKLTGHSVSYVFNGKTGEPCDRVPWNAKCFLLPFLADEPSESAAQPVAADPINPQHYRTHPSGIECIQVAEHMSYCLGNAIKYLWRAGKKGDAIEDLKKAAWYLQREIERLEKLRKGGVA